MLVRGGVAALTLVDPDELTPDNLRRHVLTRASCGQSKVIGMAEHIRAVNPDCRTTILAGRFDGFSEKPDLIACGADSDACCQLVNLYALEHNIPVVFGGVYGAAEMAEIITLVPGQTPCYACYEREGPEPEPSMEKYTNPNYDSTQIPSQPGLWGDVLMAAAIQFRAIMDVFAGNPSPLVLASLRLPYGANIIRQKKGCAVCSDDMAGLSA
jgi:molybdopterin/thiamine biosynthesis adenylyltransferase